MSKSDLEGIFRQFTCTYSAPTGSWALDPVTGKPTLDVDGNPIPATATRSLLITFEAFTNPELVLMPGADMQVLRGKGACVNPAVLPTTLQPGSELNMTWASRNGILRLLQISLDPLEELDPILGQAFIAEFRAI